MGKLSCWIEFPECLASFASFGLDEMFSLRGGEAGQGEKGENPYPSKVSCSAFYS